MVHVNNMGKIIFSLPSREAFLVELHKGDKEMLLDNEKSRSYKGRRIIFASDFNGSVDNLRVAISGWNISEEARIEAFCADLKGFDIRQGALELDVVKSECSRPAIFGWVVDPGVGTKRRALLIETSDGSAIVGPDNGLLVPAARHAGIERIWELSRRKLRSTNFSLFDGRDLFIKAAVELQEGALPQDIALANPLSLSEIVQLKFRRNEVVRVDGSGNVVLQNTGSSYIPYKTELSVETSVFKGAIPFVRSFDEVTRGKLGALRGTTGRRIWLFANQDRAADALKVEVGQVLNVVPVRG